jgi:hypothetical protein
MNSHDARAVHCSVDRGEKLPSGLTASGVCAAIRKAVAPSLERAGIAADALSVKITVESDAKLVAAATLAGKTLPEQRVASSDRVLTARAVDMLAQAIAAQVASTRQ